MSCATITPITRLSCGTNQGGTLDFKTVPIADVDGPIPPVGAGTRTITADINLAVGKFWTQHSITVESGQYKCPREGGPTNGSYKPSLDFIVDKYRDEVLVALASLEGQELLVLFEDANETPILLGDLKRPCYLTKADYDSGAKGADSAAFACAFSQSRNSLAHPPIYTGAAPTS